MDAGVDTSRWLCIVGVNSETRVGLKIDKVAGKPSFDLTSQDRDDRWRSSTEPEKRVMTGDGTVPYLGARPTFLAPENLVCLTPDDFGYWELADRALLGPVGFHGLLPKMNLIHRLRRISFRVYLHRPTEIDRAVRAAGLRLRTEQHTLFWHVVVYARSD